ncbi:MAG: acyl-[acyl-carrier-protein] thioesterase [Candidatus Cryptobacteroides sp.]
MKRYEQEIIIPCYCTDASWRLKPVSFMNYAQEAANRHATAIGFGYDDLIASRTAWVLSRMHIIFYKAPLWRDAVTFYTWHKGSERLFFLRDFLMRGKDAEPLVAATTSWLVLNLDTRRLVRDPGLVDESTVCSDNAIETPCDKVQIPKDLQPEFAMEHIVAYSDVDMNGHTNNAMYVEWAMNVIDYECAVSRPVRELKINFNHETRPADHVELYKASCEDEAGLHWFVEGRVEGNSAFCVEIIF